MGTKYSSVSISGYNASPPPDDASESVGNQITWAKHKDKLCDPIKTAVESINTNLTNALDQSAVAKTDTYTVVAADHDKTILVTTTSAGSDIIMLAANTAAAGFLTTIANAANSTDAITVKVNSGDLLNTVTDGTVILPVACSITLLVNSDADGWIIPYAHGVTITSTGSAYIDASTVSAGVARRMTAPNADDTLVGLAATQTLTNKTFADGLTIGDANMPAVSGGAPIYACRAWVNFDGTGTPASRASGNVSSITDNGTGDYTVNFTTAMPDADYSVSICTATSWGRTMQVDSSSDTAGPTTQSTSAVQITAKSVSSDVGVDMSHIYVAIFR